MEGVSNRVYKRLKCYWRRRGYQRVSGSGRRRKNPVVQLGATGTSGKRRFWRLKCRPKLKLRCFSPKNFLTGIRDAYVNMMLRLANSRAIGVSGYGNGFWNDGGLVTRPVKEYDEKVLVEMYKSMLIAQSRMQPDDAARIGSVIALRG